MQYQEVKENQKDKTSFQPNKSALVTTLQTNNALFSNLESQRPDSFKDGQSVKHGNIGKDISVIKNSHAILNQSKMYELEKDSLDFENSMINKSDYNFQNNPNNISKAKSEYNSFQADKIRKAQEKFLLKQQESEKRESQRRNKYLDKSMELANIRK